MRFTSASGKCEIRAIERTSQIPLMRDTMKASEGVNGKLMSSSMGLPRMGIVPAGILGRASDGVAAAGPGEAVGTGAAGAESAEREAEDASAREATADTFSAAFEAGGGLTAGRAAGGVTTIAGFFSLSVFRLG